MSCEDCLNPDKQENVALDIAVGDFSLYMARRLELFFTPLVPTFLALARDMVDRVEGALGTYFAQDARNP